MADAVIQTSDLARTFQALRSRNPEKIGKQIVEEHPDYKRVPRNNYAPSGAVNTGSWGSGMSRTASSAGVVYGQPAFFSPVHTPINWQIPSKRLEQYQWLYLPNTQVLTEDFIYSPLENTTFVCNDIFEDSISGGFIFDVSNYPKIMNSEGAFNQPPRISMRDCKEKRCFSFKPIGNHRAIRISEEHYIFVVDGDSLRKNKKVIGGKKYRLSKGVKSNGVEKVKIQNKLIKRIQAQDVKTSDYLIAPVPLVGTQSIDKDLAWLIGFCVADGCIYQPKEVNSYIVHFTGCKDELALIRCKEILEKNFEGIISSRKHGDGNGWRVNASTKKAYDFFRKYIINKGIEKRFSREIFSLDRESRLNVLAGYFDGDGCLEKPCGKNGGGRLIANCYSINLSDQIYWLLVSCEIACSIGKYPLYGDHYKTSSEFCYRILIPSSQVHEISKRMNGNKVPSTFIPKKERELRFFYKEDGISYLIQPIEKIEEFLYTGKGFDIEMPNDRHALVADGYVCSNCRFFYENEPKVASAIDFYSDFPMSDWEHECKNRDVKTYFDKFKNRLKLPKWCRLISHEVHLLGDCFPFLEIDCPHCNGSGKLGDEICDHEGGTIRRVVVMNPDFIEVYTSPINPDAIIAMRPDEELINMVQRKTPGYERLSPEVIKLISSGQPIRLDNRNVFHLKYGECGYTKYGVGMVRRLFPILSYKTKLMVAQWIVAERLIVPIKIVKVGSDERPAGPADIADVQSQLAMTAQDPNLTIITHHAFELDFVGAAGRVLTLSNEFEFINQEVLDGMMINNALLNGEGPNFSSAAVGIEAMIQRLETFRQEISQWIEQSIYLPEAKRQGFIDKNAETGEEEYLIPKIKWGSMHLRDQQQYRTFMIQLYDKGVISAQTLLESFDLDPDQEIERKRYDALQMIALGQGGQQQGMGGGFGGGGGGGGGGLPPLGGGGGGGAGGPPPIGAPGGMEGAGGAPGGGPSPVGGGVGGPPMAKASSMTAEVADPSQFGGRVLKKKTRERVVSDQKKIFQQQESQGVGTMSKDSQGQMRDEKGRVIFTKCERALIPRLLKAQQEGLIENTIYPQYRVRAGSEEFSLDFGIPDVKLGIEADGEIFHSSNKQVTHDKERDMKLAQQGWTILRFTDVEIENKMEQVIRTVIQSIMRKKLSLQQQGQAAQDQKTFDTSEVATQ